MTEHHKTYSFGDFTVDVTSHLLLKGQTPVHVDGKPFGGKPFQALVYLVKNPKRLITNTDLIEAVGGSVTDDAARKWIESIQAVLGDHADLIQRVFAKGWRLDAEVEINKTHKVEAANTSPTIALIRDEDEKSISTMALVEESPRPAGNSSNTFEGWVSESGLWLVLILASCVTLAFVFTVVRTGEAERALKIVGGLQCVVIIGLLLHSIFGNKTKAFRPSEECSTTDILRAGFKSRDEFETLRGDLEADLKSFRYRWATLLGSWIPLYLVFTFGGSGTAKVFDIVFNLLNTLTMLLCFDALNKHIDRQEEGHFSGRVSNYIVFLVLVVVIGGASFNNLNAATVLGGILAGTTLALFVGRLQSKFFGTRSWVIYLLYSYTAIQPLALYVRQQPELGVYVLDFALFLKCLLYLLMSWLFQSGLLLFYFARVRETDTSIWEQRNAFQRLVD
jgi:DNA-binding winged helix-turn-helix (wHTH) protein